MSHARAAPGEARLIELLTLIRLASSVLAPPRCAGCGAPCPAAAIACPRCLTAVSRNRAGDGRVGDVAVAWAAPYDGPVREIVASLKFRGRLELARLAGAVVAAAVARAGLDRDRMVVPVPASPLRRRRRGFDPGELIAAAAAAELGAPLAPCLTRRSGRRQVGRDRAARLSDPPQVAMAATAPRAALLVDDVLTTGATIGSCAATLRAAGCADVAAGVFARAPWPGGTRGVPWIHRDSPTEGGSVRIDVRGRNMEVTEELRVHVGKRFARTARQVSELARLEVELREEKNPANSNRYVAEANLFLKGATLHAEEASPDMLHSISELGEDIRRQVKRYREKRRARAKTRRAVGGLRGREA